MKYKQYDFGVQPTPLCEKGITKNWFVFLLLIACVGALAQQIIVKWPQAAEAADPVTLDINIPSTLYCAGYGTPCVEDPKDLVWEDNEMPEPEDGKSGLAYDITSYATKPTHEATITAIFRAMPDISTAEKADAYIRARRPKSPVTGKMVVEAAAKRKVDAKMVMALIQNDSSFGTAGLGARTNNPGNIANRDDGHTFTYPSWAAGVDGVARWLMKHKITQ